MDTEQALLFLRAHQPMLGDGFATQEDCNTYVAILDYFKTKHDERCLPLLINSVSPDTTLGMYEHIVVVLMQYPPEKVIPHIRQGLVNGNDGVLYRCCWWAADFSAWDLVDLIQPLTTHSDEDIRLSAQCFLELRDELQ